MKHHPASHILRWLLPAFVGTSTLHAAFDLAAWQTHSGTALTPSAF